MLRSGTKVVVVLKREAAVVGSSSGENPQRKVVVVSPQCAHWCNQVDNTCVGLACRPRIGVNK